MLLVNPPAQDFTAFDLWLCPLGLLRIGTVLKSAGCDVRILDCLSRADGPAGGGAPAGNGTGRFREEMIPRPAVFAEVRRHFRRFGLPPEEIESVFRSWKREGWTPDVAAVTTLFTYWYPGALEAAEAARRVWPGARIALGGAYATLCGGHASRRFAGCEIVRGPGEEWAGSLLRRAGIEPSPPPVFADFGIYPGTRPHAAVLSSRGCPFSCSYCASAALSGGFEPRSAGEVMADLENASTHGSGNAAFFDDAFLFDAARRAKPLLAGIAALKSGTALHFPNGLHVRYVDAETALLLKAAGAETIRLSFESTGHRTGSPSKASEEELRAAARAFSAAGYDPAAISVYTLAAAPGQDGGDVIEACEAIHRCGFKVSITLFSPIPGTPAFADAVALGLDPEEPLLQNKVAYALFMGPAAPGEMERIRSHARRLNERLARRP